MLNVTTYIIDWCAQEGTMTWLQHHMLNKSFFPVSKLSFTFQTQKMRVGYDCQFFHELYLLTQKKNVMPC